MAEKMPFHNGSEIILNVEKLMAKKGPCKFFIHPLQ